MSYSQSNAKRNPLGASLYGATARYIDKETVSTGTSFAFPVDATEIEEEEGERFQRNEQGFSCSNISTDSCGWLDFVTALICIAYSVFLIWLLAHVKDETNYYFLNFVTFFPDRAVVRFTVLLRQTSCSLFSTVADGRSRRYVDVYFHDVDPNSLLPSEAYTNRRPGVRDHVTEMQYFCVCLGYACSQTLSSDRY